MTTGSERKLIAAVEAGRLDVTGVFTLATAKRLAALRTRAKARLESGRWEFTEYAWINVNAPPFDDVDVRRAVNLAVTAGVASTRPEDPMPASRPARSSLPVSPATSPCARSPWRRHRPVSGSRPTVSEPNARRRLRHARRPDRVAAYVGRGRLGRHLVRVLRQLGFRPRLHVYPSLTEIYEAAQDPRHPAQIGINGWIADFPDPASFVRTVLGCDAYVPGEPGRSNNFSRFCDPQLDAAIDRARTAGATDGDTWLGIERRIAAQAPIVPLVDRRQIAVTSRRTGNVQFHPLTGVILGQVWVR